MVSKTSLFKLSTLPDPFGYAILILLLILLLSPYFSGGDFGIFKIPTFTEPAKKWLKIIGPILFSICIASFLPIIPEGRPGGTTCPQISGSWQRQSNPPDKWLMKIDQTGCIITSSTETHVELEDIKEQLTGKYIMSEGYFEVVIDHLQDKCRGKMYGKLYVLSNDQFNLSIYGSSGNCDMHPGGDEQHWSRF